MAPRLTATTCAPRGVDVATWATFVAGAYRVAGVERAAAERLVVILQESTDAIVAALKWHGRWAQAEKVPPLDTAALLEAIGILDAAARSTLGATWGEMLDMLAGNAFTVTAQLRALDWREHAEDFELDVLDALMPRR